MLKTNVCGVELENPLMLAAGILGSNSSSLNMILNSGAGGVVTKSFSKDPNPGYINPTTVGVDCGIINAIGLSNPGVDNFLEEIKKVNADEGKAVIASIYGSMPEEFSYLVEAVQEYVDMIELNISCPHAMAGCGAAIGQDPNLSHKIVSAASEVSDVPILAKLTPNVTDIAEIAKACEDAGADGLTLINSLGPGMVINIDVAKPVLSNKMGGMSGKAVKPIAIRDVFVVYDAVDIPIIGVGGISNYRDVVEFIYAGASAVQIGTSIMNEGVDVFNRINIGLEGFMKEKGFSSIEEMIGLAHGDING
ncbi:MAG: dihydroorotate dehydrogenase [Methanobrevibacter sp.]|uniref:dihydroorotate dehydrogenase n=1 Tax=Methanobrevibacter sp. TaxID=66852 RepID=UPI0026DFE650|nr:dihydroorotate dehydrogenase [Methanobrevibacter sp.]MDO5848101.1 dihydroorotate dehydrogenase [Methanobrevibacter sp.]